MKLLAAILIILLLAGAYYAYQRPEIRALFEANKKPEKPLDFLNNLPDVNSRPIKKKPPVHRAPPRAVEEPVIEEMDESSPVQNQIPNLETARVLMQILRAKGLASGISINVTDDSINVFGKVDSEAQKQQILDVLEKGRESRTIKATELVIHPLN